MEDLIAILDGADGLTAFVIFIVVVFLLLKLLIYVFLHYLYSRILSVACGIAFIVIYCLGFFSGELGGGLILLPILWLQYMSFIGPSAFDEYWDGTATITIDFDKETMEIKDNFVKMFAVHTAVAIALGLPFFLWGAEVPFIPLIPCIILLIVTVIGFIRQLFNGGY
jgi:hypothetical protein